VQKGQEEKSGRREGWEGMREGRTDGRTEGGREGGEGARKEGAREE